jgi:condensin complex subunit 1
VKFPKRRQKAADLACRSLEDKSSNVRRNAIKLLIKLIGTHPFSALHGGTLKLAEWKQRLDAIDAELSAFEAPIQKLAENNTGEQTVDNALLDDATMIDGVNDNDQPSTGVPCTEELPDRPAPAVIEDHSEEIARLQLTKRYYAEALRFIDTIHAASETVCQLLSAKNKSEVIEAMDFFRTLDAHQVETAKVISFTHFVWLS